MLPHAHIRQGKPFLSPGFLRLVGQCIPHWGGQGLNGPAHGNQQTNLPRFETVGFEVKRSIPRALQSCPLDDWWLVGVNSERMEGKTSLNDHNVRKCEEETWTISFC